MTDKTRDDTVQGRMDDIYCRNAAEKSEDEQWIETKIAKKPNDLWLFLERKRKKKNKNLKEVEDRLMEEKDKFKMNTKEDQSNEVEELDKSKNSKV